MKTKTEINLRTKISLATTFMTKADKVAMCLNVVCHRHQFAQVGDNLLHGGVT